MEEHNHGIYRNMDTALLPPLFLAYCAQPKDVCVCFGWERRACSRVKYTLKWNSSGWMETRLLMTLWKNILVCSEKKSFFHSRCRFASYTDEAVEALNNHDYEGFKELFKKNFQLRRKVFGDAVIKEEYIHMVEVFGVVVMEWVDCERARRCGQVPWLWRCCCGYMHWREDEGDETVWSCVVSGHVASAYEEQGYVFVRIIPYDPHLSN